MSVDEDLQKRYGNIGLGEKDSPVNLRYSTSGNFFTAG